jgi:DNA-binding NarL/FixJ family response regulator
MDGAHRRRPNRCRRSVSGRTAVGAPVHRLSPRILLYNLLEMKIRVLLADDSEIMRKVIAGLLRDDPEIELVAECGSFAQTMERASKLHPQVIVLDIHMGDERTVTPSQLKFGLIGSRLLAISIWKDDETKALADTIGAATLLDKANLATELTPAIKRYAGGRKGMPGSE